MARQNKNANSQAAFPKRWPALWALSTGVLMGTLDLSIVNVALPTLVRDLNTNFATVQWVIIIYGLISTGLMLSMGRLGDIMGQRKVFCWGLGLFTLGSLASGFSPTIYLLIAARSLQAVGSVMMQALLAAIITEMFPARERGQALGAVGAVVSVGLALGPAAGGIIISFASWHFIFLINVPLGLAALFAVLRFVPDLPPSGNSKRFDFSGTGALLASLTCYALGLTLVKDLGLGDIRVLGLLAASVACAAGFALAERRSSRAMLEPGLLRDPGLALGLVMSFLVFLVVGGTYILPFYLQYGRNLSPFAVGLLMMVAPLTMGLVSPLAGAWSDRWGEGGVRLAGLFLLSAGCWAVSTLGPQSGPWEFAIKVAPLGLGLGLFQAPNISGVMGRSPQGKSGVFSGLLSLTRNLGTTSGLPLMSAVFLAHLVASHGHLGKAVISSASAESLAAALGRVYHLAALISLAATGFSVWAWLRIEKNKSDKEEKDLTSHMQG